VTKSAIWVNSTSPSGPSSEVRSIEPFVRAVLMRSETSERAKVWRR
jgi:hypothetical protein